MNNEVLKRLEIIKNCILIDENDIALMQVLKLEKEEIDDEILLIIDLIKKNDFTIAYRLIDKYINSKSALSIFEDPYIKILKLELQSLESRLDELTDEKLQIEKNINDFNNEYYSRLGSLIKQILDLKISLSNDILSKNKAKIDFEDFTNSYNYQVEIISNIIPITLEERSELKNIYHKASRLCHPDKLPNDLKNEGERVFKELNEAYRNQDLQRVKEILYILQHSSTFNITIDNENDHLVISEKCKHLRHLITSINNEIEALKENETYQLILSIENFEEYFSELYNELDNELISLKKSI
jgi:hypothetical protein